MSYEYSENELVQNSAIELLRDTLGWRTFYAYNDEVLGNDSSSKSLGRSSYKEILLTRYLKEAVFKFNDWVTDEIFEICEALTVPMKGRAESLNASMAAALVMWEMLRG